MGILNLFQSASGAWHIPSILTVVGWLISGVLIFANLRVNRDDRIKASIKERQAAERIESAKIELEQMQQAQRPRTFDKQQEAAFIGALRDSPRGPVGISRAAAHGDIPIFAETIKHLLTKSGFPISFISDPMWMGPPPTGLLIGVADANKPPPHAMPIAAVFRAIGCEI